MDVNSTRVWVLTITGKRPAIDPHFHALAAKWHNIPEKELSLGFTPGMPVLASEACIDDRLNEYFRHGFRRDQNTTAYTYAVELRTWLTFLNDRDVRWDEARREDVRAFQAWRVYDERNPHRVRPATWNKGWAALRHFYGWALRDGWLERMPVGEQDRLKDPFQAGGYREKNARGSRDRWLTPAEYLMWRDVGLRGYLAARSETSRIEASLPNDMFRGRNTARNSAFADYLLSTGLREQEAGTLLDMEIPSSVGDKVPIIGKGGVFRHYEVMHRSGLESVQVYRDGERRDVIRRAQRERRYEVVSNRLLMLDVVSRGRRGQRIRLEGGQIIDLVTMTSQERRRLFTVGRDGLEPAALWLTEKGTAMPHVTWNSVFRSANTRVSGARAGLGVGSPWVHVTPHSLRFTFALMVLVAGARATDEHLGLGPADAFVVKNYSHVFDEVRDLLGHATVKTTEATYLEPVKGLRRSPLFRGATVDDVWAGLVAASPLIGFGGVE